MAHVDSRLQPLFAAMNEAGYDWIVGEILDAIRQGRPRLAIGDELEKVRTKIDSQDETPESEVIEFEVVETIDGDDQIDLVVDLIRARFEALALMLNESKKCLKIISSSSQPPLPEPKLAFQVEGENRWITSTTSTELSERVGKLVSEVNDWAKSVRKTVGDPQ